ncbi:MAG: glycosyltransferase family 2 protein [Oscillospiraceae bacterium]|nr:glycosyltransferase family 2 protein [Oscillospiraceae bacterium]
MLVSVVVPCYCEELSLPLFYKEMAAVADKIHGTGFEFIFIDDGSHDKTLEGIKTIAEKDRRVRYISFSRNFGKEAAVYAGLESSKGDFTAVIDADLQDPPGLLAEMIDILSQGEFDCVATRRVSRSGEPPIRSLFARCFYRIINRLSKTEIVDGARDFRIMTRKMVNAVLQMKEVNRFSKGLFSWVGFKTHWLSFENIQRVAGETKWSFWKLLIYSIEGIVGFSTAPLAVASVAGVLFCVISLVAIIALAIRQIIWPYSQYGWTSTICVVFLVSGIQLFCIGILGQYLAKTYMEIKKRPIYIVKESSDEKKEENT